MYYIQKSFEISASHHLTLSYQSKCSNVHGHNWHVTVYCKSKTLNSDGMVADFSEIKHLIHGKLDHADLNKVLPFNPTAENICFVIWNILRQKLDSRYALTVRLYETPRNYVEYEGE